MPQIHQTEEPGAYGQTTPAKKIKAHANKSPSASDLESVMAVMVCDLMFVPLKRLYRERATMDASQVNELDSILLEARGLEAHLKEKKELLCQSLAVISDKLQG
uniref:Uncharacterized protein n=1 Tax=Denticeps clupeoides TaxID=299321 RepID=A0AAY4CLY6_9TELE